MEIHIIMLRAIFLGPRAYGVSKEEKKEKRKQLKKGQMWAYEAMDVNALCPKDFKQPKVALSLVGHHLLALSKKIMWLMIL